MQIQMAHLREQGIDFAVFDADSRLGTSAARADLLSSLTAKARLSGLKIDKAALQYMEGRRLQFFGTRDLVEFLATLGGVHRWTHQLTV
jgi:hypothetical protein